MSEAREAMERAMRAAGLNPDEVRAEVEMLEADPGPEQADRQFQHEHEMMVEQIPLDAVCPTCDGVGLVEDHETGGMKSCPTCGAIHHAPALRETGERK